MRNNICEVAMTSSNSTLLSPFLEIAIFCSARVYVNGLNAAGGDICLIAVITEHSDDGIIAEIDGDFQRDAANRYRELIASDVIICIPIGDNVIEFSSKIVNVSLSPADRLCITFNNPREGALKNSRSTKRIAFAPGEKQIQAVMYGRSGSGKKWRCELIADISEEAAAVYLDAIHLPDSGLRSPESFVVKRQGKVVFRAKIRNVLVYTDATPGGNRRLVIYFDRNPERKTHTDRRVRRAALPKEYPVFMEAAHPLMPECRIRGTLEELSKLGFSFTVKDPAIPVFPGLVFHDSRIFFPYEAPIKTSIRIVHCTRESSTDGNIVHVGVEFLRFSDSLNISINRFYQKEIDETLVDAEPEDFEKIICHLFLSSFIYPQKRSMLQERAQQILATQYRLLHRNTISKTLISKKNGEISGFIQYLKYHDHAWLVQHLAGGSKCSPAAGKMGVLATIDFFLNPEVNRSLNIEYVLCYFRPVNSFPMILFDGFSQSAANSSISKTYDFDYCLATNSSKKPTCAEKFTCEPACECDLHVLEEIVEDDFSESFKRAEGLSAAVLSSNRTSNEYIRFGLLRERHVLCVKTVDGTPLAFSVCEYCSPGANLSELTNSFKFYYRQSRDLPILEKALDYLACRTLDDYRTRGTDNPIFLKARSAYLPEQFYCKKQYKFWYIHASHFNDLKIYFEEVTSNMKMQLRRFRDTISQERGNVKTT